MKRIQGGKKERYRGIVGTVLYVAGLLLSGCQPSTPANESASNKISLLPESKLTDYRTFSCSNIWQQAAGEALENPLYWLRMMDCASTLSRFQAKEMAEAITIYSWSDVLRQGILLSDADITVEQRRKALKAINDYRVDIPTTLSPLLQLWRDQQTSLLIIQEERKKYRQLQTSTDNKIDGLKDQESHLRHQLAEMTKKLEGLTDIERQLSNRKQLQGTLSTEVEKEHAAKQNQAEEVKKTDAGAVSQTTEEKRRQQSAPPEPQQGKPETAKP